MKSKEQERAGTGNKENNRNREVMREEEREKEKKKKNREVKRKKGEKVGATKLSILRREVKSEGKEEEKDGNTKIEAEELRGWWEEWNGKERGTKINMTGGVKGKKEKGRGGKGEEKKRQWKKLERGKEKGGNESSED